MQFDDPQYAIEAFQAMDGKHFQGRLLHVLPATKPRTSKLDDFEVSKLPLKKQKEIKRKAEAASSTFKWNSMYMNSDAVLSSVADRLGMSKAELLDPTSSDSAVKQAQAETHVIQETKEYLSSNGVNLDSFKQGARGDTAILVKNFPYGTKPEELKKLFEDHGPVQSFLMPPSGTIAIVGFDQPAQAKSAFASLAYRRMKDAVLFLEKAPKDLFSAAPKSTAQQVLPKTDTATAKISSSDLLNKEAEVAAIETTTLFVRNLNFKTTNENLVETFTPLKGFASARVKTKPDPKRPGQTLSMGFGFIEFKSKEDAQAALAAMNGYSLDGHALVLRASHKALDAAEERRKEDSAKKQAARGTKIIIKNLPFEATKKDVRALFGSYGQLRSVRVPKKFDSSTRGFAFVDFTTPREAENATEALRDTHLLGRRLVLEFAAAAAEDPEEEIEKMQKKVGRQSNRMALQKLTGSGRQKFVVGGDDEMGRT